MTQEAPPFGNGQQVICVDKDLAPNLVLGQIYTVISCCFDRETWVVALTELPDELRFAHRFRPYIPEVDINYYEAITT